MTLVETARHLIAALKRALQHYRYGLPTVSLRSLVPQSTSIDNIILDDICLPPYQGPDSHDDVHPFLSILRFLQPRIVVELGTGYGNSTANICQQCPGATVFTVNALPEQLSGLVTTYQLTQEEIGRVYRTHGFAKRVVQIYGDSLTIDWSPYFESPAVEFALIDACHDVDYVVNDFERIVPYMTKNGVVLFHDTHPSMQGHLEGSYLACMELRRRGYDVKYVQGTWWAIWRDNAKRRKPFQSAAAILAKSRFHRSVAPER